ncbi:MAG: hypothetical protein IH914_00415 [candidate division Zixibacteria bacterium]|nr:hypothetical protein [candidate division Zixibacteria bacterium]
MKQGQEIGRISLDQNHLSSYTRHGSLVSGAGALWYSAGFLTEIGSDDSGQAVCCGA